MRERQLQPRTFDREYLGHDVIDRTRRRIHDRMRTPVVLCAFARECFGVGEQRALGSSRRPRLRVIDVDAECDDHAPATDGVRQAPHKSKLRCVVSREMIPEFRRLWHEGIDGGPAMPLDMDAIKREARARLATGPKIDR